MTIKGLKPWSYPFAITFEIQMELIYAQMTCYSEDQVQEFQVDRLGKPQTHVTDLNLYKELSTDSGRNGQLITSQV